jgi:hypothetical protein
LLPTSAFHAAMVGNKLPTLQEVVNLTYSYADIGTQEQNRFLSP